MKVTKDKKKLHVSLEGSIGESSPIYGLLIDGSDELVIDMNGVTYVNSIGVKNWIGWTGRLPQDFPIKLMNCPHVIASQASLVTGFTPQNVTIESIRLSYYCDSCAYEDLRLVVRGVDYQYATTDQPQLIQLPSHQICPKCSKPEFEPDIIVEKTFSFLKKG